MKRLFLLLAVCLGLTCRAQDTTFSLHGTLQDIKPNQLLLLFDFSNGSFQADTLPIQNGTFHYQGTCRGREQRTLMLFDPERIAEERNKRKGKSTVMYGSFNLSLFVHPQANIQIAGHAGSFPLVDIQDKLNPLNEDYARLHRLHASQQLEINRLHYATNEARWLDDTLTVKKNEQRIQTLRAEIGRIQKDWMDKHPDSEYAAYLYTTTVMPNAPVNELEAFHAHLSDKVRNSVYGKQILEKIRANKSVVPGSQAPDFTLTDVTTGKQVSLKDYKGKYLLLDFWGSWCGPCRASHPHLLKIHEQYKNEAFAILGIAADRKTEIILQATRQDGLAWGQCSMYEERKGQQPIHKLYNVTAFPTKFLIDPQGTIEAIYLGDVKDIDNKLAEIFPR